MAIKQLLNGSPASILFILVTAQTIISLDFSLVTIALPSIEAKFGLSPITAQWILTSDIVVYGGFMIVGGRFADTYGERKALTIGLSLFLAGSLINTFSNGLALLLLGRATQGFGAAFTFPTTIALLTRTFVEGNARFKALTISTAAQATGVPLGTMAAGYLVTTFGGPSAFFLNVPICALLLFMVRFGLAERPPLEGANGKIPLTSAIVLAIGMGLLIQSALAIVAKDEQTRALAPLAFPASVVVLSLFVYLQKRSSNPLFSFSILRIENLAMYILITACMTLVGKGLIALSNISFQQGLGYSPWEASLALFPMAVSSIMLVFLTPFISRPLLRKSRISLLVAFVVMVALHLTLANTPGAFAAAALLTILLIQPFVSVTGNNLGVSEIMARAPAASHGVVAAMLYTTIQIVGGLGLALMIAAKDQGPGVVDEFQRFSPGFMVAAGGGLIAALLIIFAIKPFAFAKRSDEGLTKARTEAP